MSDQKALRSARAKAKKGQALATQRALFSDWRSKPMSETLVELQPGQYAIDDRGWVIQVTSQTPKGTRASVVLRDGKLGGILYYKTGERVALLSAGQVRQMLRVISIIPVDQINQIAGPLFWRGDHASY